MSDAPRVSPEEAKELLAAGFLYVDVRTEAEFEAGHVPGALNVPYQTRGAAGLVENPEFLAVMTKAFSKDAPLLIGCQTGARSLKAARSLAEAGFSNLQELRTGFSGSRDAFGRPEPGWSKVGLPIETGATPGQRYADVKAR
jgi:rhodanese-related sulfurtransferase